MFKNINKFKGFALVEILLIIIATAILVGILVFAINPAKQLGDTRNAQRQVDINTILNAVYQYTMDNNGILPTSITASQTEICKTGASCNGLVDLSVLVSNGKYLVAIPSDPAGSSVNGAGYEIFKTTDGHLTIIAPDAEQGVTINVSR